MLNSKDPRAARPLRGTLLLLATIAGVTVANIYYNQPLLDTFRRSFPEQASWVGVVPTVTQLGFAIGMLLLAPLGDRFDRRKLMLGQIVAMCVALIVAATAPNLSVLIATSLVIGIIGHIPQQALPFAAELASPSERGQAVGTVMSGLFLGILLARTMAGVVAEYFGWRSVFGASVIALLLLAVLILARLPKSHPSSTLPYIRLLGSLWRLLVDLRELRQATLTGAALFASFSTFWSVLAYLLAGAPFHYGPQAAGLFGLVGAAGALIAPVAGRWADRRGTHVVISGAVGLVMLSYVILAFSGTSVAGLIIGVIVLDVGVQAGQIANQSRIYGLNPDARSRINTIYMTAYFLGGALGSAAATVAWAHFGWMGVCIAGIGFAAIAGWSHRRGSVAL
ncbi:major facilitator transporter [Caballeronia peredens]|nr:major facilitator transporter [Caballeronia peredens]